MAFNQSLSVCKTEDGGKSWVAQSNGLPQSQCYDIVYRYAFDNNNKDLIFGTTTDNLYYSSDEGERWQTISNNLPMIYSVEIVEL
ncbi:MAG TPA: WD40/YVTN/BNR-like repeat-containing protein [Cyclobacteriaceae bacterium]